MGKTWMPNTAGILDIVAGAIGILLIAVVSLAAWLIPVMASPRDIPGWIFPVIIVFLVIRLLINILAIIGGAFCIRKKAWGLGLAGSIAAIFAAWILGIPALIFVIMGKDQFK